ncbi:PAS domain-containing sensor histidine kinase [Pelagerythrobacter marensis]|uniref:histidine kinase n=1 Tax=Pelagerythrobacter marensis TaxID=543877 RepID=A0A0G3XA50_9SPHN|nr:PAS domain-containing sensor histidine kinase [Pelagerythrobacter marensis]AKM07238.1 GAF sensor signal transduction histidine kinase [Pelagerythrobacter marensis]
MSDPAAAHDDPPAEDLKDLYDNAPCGYLSLSPDGRIVKMNRTLCDWIGRNDDALLGHTVHEILSFGGKIAFETHLAPLLRLQGFVHEIALDLVDAGGNKIPVIANAAERRGEGDRHLFTRLTVFKAVDRRTFERSLIEARIKAETQAKSEHEAIELRDQFIAVLGHDLRNPLAALEAGTRLIRRCEGLGDREHLILREMDGSIVRANRLIDDVMDFARGRLGGGLAVQKIADAPLQETLEQVLAESRAIAPRREFQVSMALDRAVDCDPARIGQLASNLLGNAISHGAPDLPIVLEAHTTNDEFRLSIANGGDPIPADARDRLFEPFYRADFREGQKGLGLGLFIASEIARLHGGALDVVSDENETRFTLAIPRRDPTAIEAGKPAA